MSKIFVVMGKSASGKDTIYKELALNKELSLKTVVSYTTRPIRSGEENGREYYFVTTEEFNRFQEKKLVIEQRGYETVHGLWNYFTVNDNQINLGNHNYVMIGTVESFEQIKQYYGEDIVKPIYINVENGIRLQRALNREMGQKEPKYAEMCRRFLADEQDFSEENLKKANIQKKFENNDLNQCLLEITNYIKLQVKE